MKTVSATSGQAKQRLDGRGLAIGHQDIEHQNIGHQGWGEAVGVGSSASAPALGAVS